ncbi:MAG: tetratricopeptide repeat protein [Planctomycetes bacterium]|nr:tetratricopeptide repeat protein [Planctomycetota bacterium]
MSAQRRVPSADRQATSTVRWQWLSLRSLGVGVWLLILLAIPGWAFRAAVRAAQQPEAARQPAAKAPAQPEAKPPSGKAAPPQKAKPKTKRRFTGRESQQLPRFEEMELPTVAQLLQEPPVDWIVLKSGEVLVVQPVQPRPDTLRKLRELRQKLVSQPPPTPVRQPGESRAAFENRRAKIQEEYEQQLRRTMRLEVTLPDNVLLSEDEAASVYLLDIEKIQEIIHHEDLMLRRIDRLIEQGKLQTAYELLLVLERRAPNWPGLKQRRLQLSVAEAKKRVEKDPEAALALLEQVHDENPRFPRLSAELGRVTERLIQAALDQKDYRRARFFLARLKRREADHPVVRQWEAKLKQIAAKLLEQSQQATKQGRHDQAAYLAEEAARVWPHTTQLRAVHRRALTRYQIVRVGVTVLPGQPDGFPLPSLADQRHRHLTELRLFEADHFREAAHYRTRFFDTWEPDDLGRQTHFTLRQRPAYWESQPILTASDVVASLSARLDRTSEAYDERLASFVRSLVVRSPFEFSVYFDKVPARLEALLALPAPVHRVWGAPMSIETGESSSKSPEKTAQPTPKGSPNRAASGKTNSREISSPSTFPFYLHHSSPERIVYRRTRLEPEKAPARHVAEIVETRYPSYRKAVQGLLRGEVSMLPEVPTWYIKPLRETKDYFILPYAVPTTHLIQIHPKSWLQRNRELRRAMAFAINREQILKEVVLHDEAMKNGRLITGFTSSKSTAYNDLIEPFPYNLTLAVSLATVAMSQMEGKVPPIRMVCDPDPIARQAAQRIVQDWSRAGVRVTLITTETETVVAATADDQEAAGNGADGNSAASGQQHADGDAASEEPPWDIAYRRMRMIEPLTELWPFLTLEPTAEVRSLMFLPVWLRQELIALDSVADWASAVTLLRQLQDDLHSQVLFIPLWEVDDALVIRKNIQHAPVNPVHAYQHVERWQVEPWYSAAEPR